MIATGLDAITDAIRATGLRHEIRGRQIHSACPSCNRTGRPGRRKIVITEQPRGLVTVAYCGCQIIDIARALDLPASALLSYRYSREPDARSRSETSAEETYPRPRANAKPRGVTLAVSELKKRNVKCVMAVAADLDRLFARLAPGDWQPYAAGRAAVDLGHDRTSIRRALRWLVAHNIIEERQLQAPGEKVEVTTKAGGKRETAKSGVKLYRPLTEEQQIKRLARRAPASG